jgi:hypothetical protein
VRHLLEIDMSYVKVRFSNEKGATAGLVVPTGKLASMTISEVSMLFPMSEARFMTGKLEVSREFQDWEAAFYHDFSA